MQSWCTHGRWDSLAEGEVGLVACCHAAPFSAASFSGVTRRWGRCRHVFVPCRHSATASCCHLVLGAVVFVTSLLHPGALFGQAQWIVFILQKRRIFLKTKQFQGYDLKIEKRLKVLWRQEWGVLTLATQVGQNQSPSGIWVILGRKQYMWQPRSQPSHSSRHSSLSPFLQTWQVFKKKKEKERKERSIYPIKVRNLRSLRRI